MKKNEKCRSGIEILIEDKFAVKESGTKINESTLCKIKCKR